MGKRVVLITQARVGSSRLNSKVLKEIFGKSLLEIQLSRVKKCRNVDQIIVATPEGDRENPIHEICNNLGIDFFKGSENNLLERYYQAANHYSADWVVRITSDCPLIDPSLIDFIISKVVSLDKDYGSNTLVETYPDGQDIEVFKFKTLEDARFRVSINSDKEHVTPYIKRNCEINDGILYSCISIENKNDYSDIRMTVDEIEDFDAINQLVKSLGFDCQWEIYADYILKNKSKFTNQKIIRNEGYFRSLNND